MNYYVVETDKHKLIQKTAGVKARQDVETIFKWNNFKKIEIPCLIEGRENKTRLGKIKAHYDVYMLWKNALKKIKKNDWIYIQFPLLEHTMLFSLLIKNLEKRGIHTSIIIHDVEAIRFTLRNDVPLSRKIRMRFEEISSFKNCSKIIVHNEKMKSFMHEKWKIHKDKMDILGIFDYLVENYNEELLEKRNLSRKGPVIIAGALSKHKAGYIYNLPENCNFNLYGINFEREKASSNTNYVGAFNPEELIYNLQGSFGLVWDGDSSATCTGVYGDYLKINNPHKTSMYLAAGIPVIIWEEAALANFIKKNHCGITIKSTDEIRNIIDNMLDTYLGGKYGISQYLYQLDLPFLKHNGLNTGNVYTTFYQFYYDFGYDGIVPLMAIIALYFSCAYRKIYNNKPFTIIIYAYLFNDLIMLIFSDRFYETVASIGFVKHLLVTFILYKVLIDKGVALEYRHGIKLKFKRQKKTVIPMGTN